jgi:class 3 adenylate cyclase
MLPQIRFPAPPQFDYSAQQVKASSNDHMQDIFRALDIASKLTTTFIKQQEFDSDGLYPAGFVTIPNHEILLGDLRRKTQAVLVAYAPRIETQNEVALWSQYYHEMYVISNKSSDLPATSRQGELLSEIDRATANASEVVPSGPLSSLLSSILPIDQIWRLQAYDSSNVDNYPIVDDFWFCPSMPADGTSSSGIHQRVDQKIEELTNGAILTPLWSVVIQEEIHAVRSVNSLLNWNALSDPAVRSAVQIVSETNHAAFQDMRCPSPILWTESPSSAATSEGRHISPPTDGRNLVAVAPVFAEFTTTDGTPGGADPRGVVGYLLAIVPWTSVFQDVRGKTTNPVEVVVEDECRASGKRAIFTVHVQKDEAAALMSARGASAPDYDELASTMSPGNLSAMAVDPIEFAGDGTHSTCWNSSLDGRPLLGPSRYGITVYPTDEFQENYKTNAPFIYAAIVFATFLCVSVAFLAFNLVVERKQRKLLLTAQKQNAIVSSLFPKVVRKHLMTTVGLEEETLGAGEGGNPRMGRSYRSLDCVGSSHSKQDTYKDWDSGRSYASGMSIGGTSAGTLSSRRTRPVADLFPETTIMFADIVGFSEWSALREPSQVFVLLESIFAEFDALAKRRRVYKVEVVGDCYVGVCGLPDPRKQHAVVMARFALACLDKMDVTTQGLMTELGPETAELRLQVGLHSGPVVAGVLRGDRTRFQLFGDSMNTASRMKSTGLPNRIQVSQETADRLVAAGKGEWLKARSGRVLAKGKGELQTYFLSVNRKSSASSSDGRA